MIDRPTLIVMAKAPRIGVGKTRLAADIGRVEAWRVNRALQRRTLREACDPRWRTLLCVTPDSAVEFALPTVWPPPQLLARAPQGEGDLGERMARALKGRRMVAMIGVDCPMLKRRHIAVAFAALRRAPFAIGPARDGGFWLIAAREGRTAAAAMSGVRWSTRHAAADVISNLGSADVARLQTLADIDSVADLANARYSWPFDARRASRGV
jgi:rSAM/selenodomain-associated transferase 1